MFDKPEFAVAAYNAGETRVEEWTTGQTYEELPEFVESIPFTANQGLRPDCAPQCRTLPPDLLCD